MKKTILILGILVILGAFLVSSEEGVIQKRQMMGQELNELKQDFECPMNKVGGERYQGKADFDGKNCFAEKREGGCPYADKMKEDYGKIHKYGSYALIFGIGKLACIALIAFMVSVIFWLTHNWLVKGKK